MSLYNLNAHLCNKSISANFYFCARKIEIYECWLDLVFLTFFFITCTAVILVEI